MADKKTVTGDWRIIRETETEFVIKRAFSPTTRFDMLRYALPIIIFCLFIFIFKDWYWAFGYLAIVAIKWFLVETHIRKGHGKAQYHVSLLGYVLFEADLD